jgi:GNAT superfamily N-acetyltransferase
LFAGYPAHSHPSRICGLRVELSAVAASGKGGRSVDDPVIEAKRDGYEVSTDRNRLDPAAIHRVLSTSYWSPGLPLDVLTRAIDGSLCFGLYHDREQVGFARVITDRATFAYLCDVYVLERHRGRGLGRWLIEMVVGHPSLQGLRRFVLVTRDAHGLYQRHGFRPLARPEGYMEVHRPDIYARATKQAEPLPGLEGQ